MIICLYEKGKIVKKRLSSIEKAEVKASEYRAKLNTLLAILNREQRLISVGVGSRLDEEKVKGLIDEIAKIERWLPSLEKAIESQRDNQVSARLDRMERSHAENMANIRDTIDKSHGQLSRQFSEGQRMNAIHRASNINELRAVKLEMDHIKNLVVDLHKEHMGHVLKIEAAVRTQQTWIIKSHVYAQEALKRSAFNGQK